MSLLNILRHDTQTTPHSCQSCRHFPGCRFWTSGGPRRDCITSPAVAYASILIDECQHDIEAACNLAKVQINFGRNSKHWIEVYSVLVGENHHA